MRKTLIPFPNVPQLSKTDVAYAAEDVRLRPFYAHTPGLQAFPEVIAAKKQQTLHRTAVVEVLQEQYAALESKAPVSDNIAALNDDAVFTVVTAHQPAILLGPLYFLYKAISTIRLATAVQAHTGHRIVPVFVLGSEDHDLEELNHIRLFGKEIVWELPQTGAVGSMDTASLTSFLQEVRTVMGAGANAQALFARIERAYTQMPTIAAATRALLHDLLGDYGLLVLDMNHPALKRLFLPVLRAELLEQPSIQGVRSDADRLSALGFKPQATPRDINLFYLRPGLRARIVPENDAYRVLDTDYRFTRAALLQELEQHPEHFSPNVVLRPLYQEWILPNLAYVGGGGELAYWLERKSLFAHFQVPFPMLVRRHSCLWADRDAVKKTIRFNLPLSRFFEEPDALVRSYVKSNTDATVHLKGELAALKNIYQGIAQKAAAIDITLEKSVRADELKALSMIEQWESRLLRAEKQRHEVALNQIRALREKLFPGGSLQERQEHFIPFLMKYGNGFTDTLLQAFVPFEAGFVLLEDFESA